MGSAEGFVNELSTKAHELLQLFDDQIIIDEVVTGSKSVHFSKLVFISSEELSLPFSYAVFYLSSQIDSFHGITDLFLFSAELRMAEKRRAGEERDGERECCGCH